MIAALVLAFALRGQTSQTSQTSQTTQGGLTSQTGQAEAPATLRGRVVTSDGRPMAGAHLRLTRGDNPQRPRNQSTDDDGSFEFTDLRSGQYTLFADKSGFANSIGIPFSLGAGEIKEHVDVSLRRLSAIDGRVVDDNGDPIEGAVINAMRLRPGGRRTIGNASQRRTNELGRYRVYNLQPGDYIVSASVGSVNGGPMSQVPGYATTFFPGTMNIKDAQAVHVDAAEDVPSIDFAMIAVKTASIFGQMIGADGQPFQGGIQLSPSRRAGAIGGGSVGAVTYRDGRFEFPNVAPGDYVIDSTHNNEHGFAWVSVSGADVPGVIVQTQPGSSMTGRIEFDGASAPPGRISIVAAAVDPDVGVGGQPNAAVRSDYVFQLGPLWGARRLKVGSSAGWALKAILVNGQDVTDVPLNFGSPSQSLRDVEVVLTDQLTSLTGVIRGVAPGSAPYVIAFSDDRERWDENSRYFAARRAAFGGTFAIPGLPAGGYLVAAIDKLSEGMDPAQLMADTDLLERLAREASHATLNERQTTTVELRVISIP